MPTTAHPGTPGRVRLTADGPGAQSTPRAPRRISLRLASGLLVILTPVVVALAVALGPVTIPPGDVVSIVLHHLFGTAPTAAAVDDHIVWEFRVPRVLLSLLAGAALAVAGAVLQTVIRNPLADPYVLGIASGASLGAVSVLVLGATGAGFLASLGVSGAAFAGAVVTLAIVLALGRRHGRLDPPRLILSGVAVTYLFQAGTSFLQLTASPDKLSTVLFWLLGSVAGAKWSELAVPAVAVVLCLGWLLGQGRRLNALMMGDDVASALGIDLARFRTVLLVICALLTALVVAVAGGVGFVGLIAPHFVRLLSGPNHLRSLPLTSLVGGLFLVVADLAGRTVAAPLELPLSVITAVVGVPVFLFALLRRRPGVAA